MLGSFWLRPLTVAGSPPFLARVVIASGVVRDAGLDVALFARLSAAKATVTRSRFRFVRAAHSAC